MFDTHQPPAHDPKMPPVKEVSPEESTVLGLAFAGELGYLIAVPVLLFGVGGAYLDKYLQTQHLFLFLGFCLAFTVSAMSVSKTIRRILARMPKDLPRKKKKLVNIDPETVKEQEALHDLFRPKE